jgi:hypothetical protein
MPIERTQENRFKLHRRLNRAQGAMMKFVLDHSHRPWTDKQEKRYNALRARWMKTVDELQKFES